MLAKNDSCLGQIVGRKLHRDFIARHDSNEMFAHLTGDMSEHVALAWKVHAKHRTWQHLGYRPFGHDLLFLWHNRTYAQTISLSTFAVARDAANPGSAPVSGVGEKPALRTSRSSASSERPMNLYSGLSKRRGSFSTPNAQRPTSNTSNRTASIETLGVEN